MSRYIGLHCKTDDMSSSHEFNHGENLIRSIVKAYPHIKALDEADENGMISISVAGYGHIDLLGFLSEHYGHDLELQDEYGNVEPITQEPEE